MRLKVLLLSILSLAVIIPATAQVVPAAQKGRIGFPFTIGAGPSGYDVDWGNGRMYGTAIWADWRPNVPIATGLGLELEARDINFDAANRPGFTQKTIGIGPSYTWYHFQSFRPYAKFLFDYGRTDFNRRPTPPYTHFDGLVRAPGIGFEYRFFKRLWFRGDYEYQFWSQVAGETPDPQGFTAGVSWDFAHLY